MLGSCDSEPTSETTVETVTVNPALERKDVVIVSVGPIPDEFDPIYSSGTVAEWIRTLCYEGVRTLSSYFEVEDDGYRVEALLKDTRFHGGEQVTADDIKYSYDKILVDGYRGPYQYFARKIKRIEVDTSRVIFIMNEPVSASDIGFELPILSRSYTLKKTINGTGDYQWISSEPQNILLEQVETGEKFSLVALPFAEAKEEFEKGNLDVIKLPLDKEDVNWAKKISYAHVKEQIDDLVYYVGFGTDPLWKNSAVRQGIAKVINKDKLILQVFSGFAEQLDVPAVAESEWLIMKTSSYREEYMKISREQHVLPIDGLLSTLETLGWRDTDGDGWLDKDGQKLTMTYYVYMDVDWSYQMAQYLNETLAQMGIELTLKYTDYNTLQLLLQSGQIDGMWGFAWHLEPDAPPSVMFEKEGNIFGYTSLHIQDIDSLYLSDARDDLGHAYANWHYEASISLPVLPICRKQTVWLINNRIEDTFIERFFK